MATEKQIAANRRNAQKSTGPRTEMGKALAAINALKTGIYAEANVLPFEDADELQQLATEYTLHHQPQTPEMRACLDRLVRAEWLQRRLFRIEAMLFEKQLATLVDPEPGQEAATAYQALETTLQRLQTRINAAERQYRNALKDMQFLEKETKQTITYELALFLNTVYADPPVDNPSPMKPVLEPNPIEWGPAKTPPTQPNQPQICEV